MAQNFQICLQLRPYKRYEVIPAVFIIHASDIESDTNHTPGRAAL